MLGRLKALFTSALTALAAATAVPSCKIDLRLKVLCTFVCFVGHYPSDGFEESES